MIDQFQKLDELIVEHTQPPIRTMLRNQLALTREQVEAYQAASDKQDHTLSRQAKTIAALQKTNQDFVEKYEKPHAEKHKIGVTLKNGQKAMYDADAYAILPNSRAPQMVEFRRTDKAKQTYRRVAHAKWSEIAELHFPPA